MTTNGESMAKRKSSRKTRKAPQRSELVLNFALVDGTNYISIPFAMSIINRKLFRSARTYAVSGVSLYTKTDGSTPNVQISTLPDNWAVRNATKKGFYLWKQMNDKILEDNPSLKGTWSDFKPSFDADHTVLWDAGSPSLRPMDASFALALSPAEWQQAEIVFPQHSVDPGTGEPLAAVTRHLHVLGADDAAKDSVGIVHGYQSTRTTVQAEDPADDAVDPSNWMVTLFDEGSSDPELFSYVVDENDRPPYDQDEYPGADANYDGGQLQCYLACSFNTTTGATKTADHAGGFLAPLGLMKIESTSVSGTNWLQIRLAPGMYHGCAAESMI